MRKRSRPAEPAVFVTTRGGPFTGVEPRTLQRRARKMLRKLELRAVELSVALVSDAIIRELNRDYRHKDRPTDVLAFALREGPTVPTLPAAREALGDVIISVDTARRQARRRTKPLLDELTMLLAHGLLHLLGYDHATAAEERVMKRLTQQLQQAASGPLSRLRGRVGEGVSPPFVATSPRPGAPRE